MAEPDFSKPTIDTLAARAAHICSNTDCSSLTVGPVDGHGALKTKLGEAAHIKGARANSARYDKTMTDAERADISNAIWLCASCHTMIDKNSGTGFPETLLKDWKSKHESTIKVLLHSHKSPMPLLRKFSEEAVLAQEIVDVLENHGALYVSMHNEVSQHVANSFDRLRTDVNSIIRKIKLDTELKKIAKEIVHEAKQYMNVTGVYTQLRDSELLHARNKVGICVRRLINEYGAKVHGPLLGIVP